MEPLLRREDARLATGRGQFVHDLQLPGTLYAAFVRSPVAHGRLQKIGPIPHVDALVGSVVMLTREQLDNPLMPSPNSILKTPPLPCSPLFAHDEVNALGQPIALVVANRQVLAREIAEAIHLEIDPLPVANDFGEAAAVLATVTLNNTKLEGTSKFVAKSSLKNPRVIAMSLEPRATIAQWDETSQRLTVWLPTQSPARARDDIAACLGMDKSAVHLIAPDVGGAFGAKASVYPEDLLIALAARHLKATVSWQSTRSEEFLSGMHGRASELQGELRVDAAGHFVGLAARAQFALGAWLPFSALVPLRNATRILPGPYRVAHVNIEGEAKPSNAAPVNIYRGAGRPEAALLMETLIDRAARQLSIDPIELRRRNLIPASALPYTTPTGEVFDSGDFAALLDRASERFGYAAERAEQSMRRARGELVGLGCALYVEPCGQGFEAARVSLFDDGRIIVASGAPAQGQGHATTFARIALEALTPHLNCTLDQIEVVLGDTALCPDGVGALASRSTAIGGSAIVLACEQLIAKHEAGNFAYPLVVEARFTAQEAWSSGCVFTRVRVDSDTGELSVERLVWVDDAGRVIEPALVKGQLLGGLAQGLGQALMEQIVYDDQGQLLTGSLMDYAVPRAEDMPQSVELDSISTPSPNNPLGAKGVGEAGCIGVPAALMNAARDALFDFDCDALHFPLTSEKLWRCMQRA